MAGVVRQPEAPTASTRGTGGRGIGPGGSVARLVVGSVLLAEVIAGHAQGGWRLAPWILAIVVFPAVLLIWQRQRARRGATRLVATGPLAHAANIGVFFLLYFGGELVPAFDPASDAALIFYGASMLLAAARGYPGCEVLAVSNWVLRLDDQIGCAVFFPVDLLEQPRSAIRSTVPSEPAAGSDAAIDPAHAPSR